MKITQFSIQELLAQCFRIFEDQAKEHSIELSRQVPEDIGTITADERRVRQLIFNLLSNAIKFTPEGGRVGVIIDRKENDFSITVWDTGIGIAEADMYKLFQPFQQF